MAKKDTKPWEKFPALAKMVRLPTEEEHRNMGRKDYIPPEDVFTDDDYRYKGDIFKRHGLTFDYGYPWPYKLARAGEYPEYSFVSKKRPWNPREERDPVRYWFKDKEQRDLFDAVHEEIVAHEALGQFLRKQARTAQKPVGWDPLTDEERENYRKRAYDPLPLMYLYGPARDKVAQEILNRNVTKWLQALEHPATTLQDLNRIRAQDIPNQFIEGFTTRGVPRGTLRSWWRNTRGQGKITPEGDFLITRPKGATTPNLSFQGQSESTLMKHLYDEGYIRHVPYSDKWLVPGWYAKRIDPQWKDHYTTLQELASVMYPHPEALEGGGIEGNETARTLISKLGTILSPQGLRNVTRAFRAIGPDNSNRLMEELDHFVNDYGEEFYSNFGQLPSREEPISSLNDMREYRATARQRREEEQRRQEELRRQREENNWLIRELGEGADFLAQELGRDPTPEEVAEYQKTLNQFTYSEDIEDLLSAQTKNPWIPFSDAENMREKGLELGHCYGEGWFKDYRDKVKKHKSILLNRGNHTAEIVLQTDPKGIITGAHIKQVKAKKTPQGSQPDVRPDAALLKLVDGLIGKSVKRIARDDPTAEKELSDRLMKIVHECDPYGSLNQVLQERGRYA